MLFEQWCFRKKTWSLIFIYSLHICRIRYKFSSPHLKSFWKGTKAVYCNNSYDFCVNSSKTIVTWYYKLSSFLYPSLFNSCWLKTWPWCSRIKQKNLRVVVVVVCVCVNVRTHPAQTLPSVISSFRSQGSAKQPQLWRHCGIPVSSVRGHQSTGSITLPVRVRCDGKLPQWDLQPWAKSRSTAAERGGAAFSNSSNILDYRPHDSQLATNHENQLAAMQ